MQGDEAAGLQHRGTPRLCTGILRANVALTSGCAATGGCILRGRSPCTLRHWKVQWCVPMCREQTTDTRPTGVELSNPKL